LAAKSHYRTDSAEFKSFQVRMTEIARMEGKEEIKEEG
jgi:hypothetical protein